MISQDMAQPLDPLRLKGTMLDTQKVAMRNLDKTGKGGDMLLNAGQEGGGGGRGGGGGDAMQVE